MGTLGNSFGHWSSITQVFLLGIISEIQTMPSKLRLKLVFQVSEHFNMMKETETGKLCNRLVFPY